MTSPHRTRTPRHSYFTALAPAALGLALVMAACSGAAPPAPKEADTSPGDAPSGVEAESAAADDAAAGSTPGEGAAGEGAAPAGKKQGYAAFDSLSPGDKLQHMKTVVVPEMKAVFTGFDQEEFADFSCATCHGARARQGNFEMPNPDLPLDAEEMAEHPEITEFMKTKVVPEMARLMGEAPYDPATHEGFGCFECHTKKD